jgi:hypothetical protein
MSATNAGRARTVYEAPRCWRRGCAPSALVLLARDGVDVAIAGTEGGDVMSQPGVGRKVSIQIDSCSAQEMIVVTTRSSVYELVVVRGDHGHISVRGGRHFPEFRSALFLYSTQDDGLVAPRTIDIGLRMKFVSGDRSYLTSAVQSICRRPRGASTECAQPPDESRAPRDSHGSPTVMAAS